VSAAAASPGTSLTLVGPVMQDYRDELERVARTGGDGDWLRFSGELPHARVLEEISRADVLALPSLRVYEAFPYAVLEGMACGKPILATSVGAVPDMIGTGDRDAAGICVEPGDVPQLVDAVKQLRDNKDMRIQMGKNGEARVQTYFDAEKISKQLSELWLSIVEIRNEKKMDITLIRR
jgi:glycosyltransferase involved in cell wall biosynthesis